jgi:hypothetical protein
MRDRQSSPESSRLREVLLTFAEEIIKGGSHRTEGGSHRKM